MSPARLGAALAALLLGGCATLDLEGQVEAAAALARPASGAEVRLLQTAQQRQAAAAALDRMLASPLAMDDAARIAVGHSPAFQSLLFEGAAATAEAVQSARMPNPVFTFERLVRGSGADADKDIGRMLAFSVFDLLLLPTRLKSADYRQRQLQVRIAGEVVDAAAQAREAWVRAVAAQQAVAYAQQVMAAAEAGAELARRMQAVGNFSKLQRAREQAFYAEAAAQVARAEQGARAAREALVRMLGLDAERAARLTLPERLPDLPAAPRDESAMAHAGLEDRLDVRMARAELEYLGGRLGATRVAGYVDGLHVAAVRNSETGKTAQRGFEIEVPLPVFDFGDARRAQAEATYLAALHRAAAVTVAAASHLRESYGAYRSAYDLARHYRDEVVPLRKAIADEMLLKYNGMLVGVFDLLADSREQIASVVQAIDAQRDFWLAATALDAAIVGRPLAASTPEPRPAASAAGGRGH